MAVLITPPVLQFFGSDGVTPLAGGKIYTYAASTTTEKATYTDASGTTEQTNPIILDAAGRATIWGSGSYKIRWFDSADVFIDETDDITTFTTTGEEGNSFFQSFSGDASTTVFTLSEDLGTDEKLLMVFGEFEYSENGKFTTDTAWTKGTGWTIGAGVATATGPISTSLSQDAPVTLVEGRSYTVTYTITQSSGSITPNIAGVAGSARSSGGTYTDTIVAGSTQVIEFSTSSFTGTLDNVTVTQVGGFGVLNVSDYTVSGTSLTFGNPPAFGTNNLYVFAPSRLAAAASASASAAESSASDAATTAASVLGLSATSTTSTPIGTGSKVFATQSGKGFSAGMWVLAVSDADAANYMHGQVVSYSGTTLTLNITNTGGSGTLADWTLNVSGTRGAQGPTGSIGDISAEDSATITVNDEIVFADVSDGNNTKKDTVQALLGLVPDASTSTKGIVELATSAEVTAGASGKIPDAAQVKSLVDGTGSILGRAYNSTTTTGSTTNTVPQDNTSPQVSEMGLAVEQSYTPVSATSTLIIEYSVVVTSSENDTTMLAALFQDGGASALDVKPMCLRDSLDAVTIAGRYEVASGSIAARTYKAYYGGVYGTSYLNRLGGGATLGGMRSYISITEVK